ncbi:glycosyltransferase family 4 protein [Nocardioides panacis]|uniref:Glycosyltransferase family 4 protein n=1 Tax=Nocardioides panacis TaxID=2849501 RepID=A0A975T0U6_9ACTN|nr:glycosyltransferase family 4 protein [Nocardioides panacis]QWZ09553.1 glycosyltransferase family 4 protein [Nocardioides panacis]
MLSIAFTNYPVDTRVRREAEALVARGMSVDVICPWTPSLGGRRWIDGVTVHPVGTLELQHELSPLAYIQRDVAFVVRAAVAALRLQVRNRYDVVQVNTMPDYLVAAAALPKLLGAKVVLDVHDLVPELYAAKFGVDESSLVIKLVTFVERCCVRLADRALAVHRPHLEALLRHGNRETKFSIVMNTPDMRFFSRRNEPSLSGPFVLLYHGTVSRRHGLETAVRAVEIARQTYDDIELLIVGEGDDVERLKGIVDARGLGQAVRFEGMRPVEQLRPLFERASAGIVPYVEDPFTRYMLPVKLLEDVALGLPVISSETSTIRAYFDETMVAFVRPGDIADLAAKIVALRRDPELRDSLVRNADTFLEHYSWAHESEQYHSLIEGLAASRTTRFTGLRSMRNLLKERTHGQEDSGDRTR